MKVNYFVVMMAFLLSAVVYSGIPSARPASGVPSRVARQQQRVAAAQARGMSRGSQDRIQSSVEASVQRARDAEQIALAKIKEAELLDAELKQKAAQETKTAAEQKAQKALQERAERAKQAATKSALQAQKEIKNANEALDDVKDVAVQESWWQRNKNYVYGAGAALAAAGAAYGGYRTLSGGGRETDFSGLSGLGEVAAGIAEKERQEAFERGRDIENADYMSAEQKERDAAENSALMDRVQKLRAMADQASLEAQEKRQAAFERGRGSADADYMSQEEIKADAQRGERIRLEREKAALLENFEQGSNVSPEAQAQLDLIGRVEGLKEQAAGERWAKQRAAEQERAKRSEQKLDQRRQIATTRAVRAKGAYEEARVKHAGEAAAQALEERIAREANIDQKSRDAEELRRITEEIQRAPRAPYRAASGLSTEEAKRKAAKFQEGVEARMSQEAADAEEAQRIALGIREAPRAPYGQALPSELSEGARNRANEFQEGVENGMFFTPEQARAMADQDLLEAQEERQEAFERGRNGTHADYMSPGQKRLDAFFNEEMRRASGQSNTGNNIENDIDAALDRAAQQAGRRQ